MFFLKNFTISVKKIYRSKKYISHGQARARSEAVQKESHGKRLMRRRLDGATPPKRSTSRGAKRHFHRLVAPQVFSLVENPEEVIRYFDTAHRLLRSGTQVNFDLSSVVRVTADAIALMVSKVRDSRFRRGTNVSGNAPQDAVASRMFDESGFYDHVTSKRLIVSEGKNLLLHKVTRNKVENEEAKKAGQLAVKHLYGDGRRIRPLYEVLIECMANTNNHASLDRRHPYDWWLFVYNDPDSKRTIFTILDLGVGLFQSLPVRQFWRDPLRRIGLSGNLDIVPKLFAGEISSRTGKSERGKGLPRIYEHATNGAFTRFSMIANDVHVDLISGTRKRLPKAFGGTLYSFEIVAVPQ